MDQQIKTMVKLKSYVMGIIFQMLHGKNKNYIVVALTLSRVKI